MGSYAHFKAGETQRGAMTHGQSHSEEGARLELDPQLPLGPQYRVVLEGSRAGVKDLGLRDGAPVFCQGAVRLRAVAPCL